jgi:hypothetical protein
MRWTIGVGECKIKNCPRLACSGITFALLRRFRELVWIGLGFLCLALVGGRAAAMQEGRTHDSGNGS